MLIFLLLLTGSILPASAHDLAGQPPIRQFEPTLEVHPENYAIAQDAEGVVHVGNSDGVLLFDGARWSRVPSPNGELVRSLAADGDGRVYVGGYDAFGYLETDATGARHFIDLTPAAMQLTGGEKFADIWDLLVTPDMVVFRGVKDVFLYWPDSGEMKRWHSEGRFGAVTWFDGELVLQWRGEGLKRFTGDGWELLAGTEELVDLVYELLPLPDGSLLGFDANDRWLRFDGGRTSDYSMPAGFPPSSRFATSVVLENGNIAFSSVDGWVYILDPGNADYHRFHVGDLRLSDIVKAVDGGLLVVDDLAVSHIGWPSDWTLIGSESGLAGSFYNARRRNGRWTVMSGAGAFVSDSSNGELQFMRREWTPHEAWDLVPLEDGTALFAESYRLMLIEEGDARPLTHANFYPRVLVRGQDPDIVYVGTELGFAVLQRQAGNWRILLERDDLDNLRVTRIVPLERTRFLFASERGGTCLVELAGDLRSVESIQCFDAADGLEGHTGPSDLTHMRNGRIIASTNAGFFEFTGDGFRKTLLSGLESLRQAGECLRVVPGSGGELWAFSHLRLFMRTPGSEWQQERIGGLRRGAIKTVLPRENGGALVVASAGLMSYVPQSQDEVSRGPKVRLRSVEIRKPGGERQRLPLDGDEPVRLPQGDYGISFAYSLADFRTTTLDSYEARLLGFEQAFSAPSTITHYTYSRLSPGEYRFEVRARDAEGRLSQTTPFEFVITPPWYRAAFTQYAAGGLLVLLVIGATILFERNRTRRIENERALLSEKVAERTRELEDVNRKLETMAHLDGLTGIPNRRRLDAYLDTVWQQGITRGRPLSLLVIDVDHFKEFNDRFGHLAGDRLLKELANMLMRCLRRTEDLVARYGGEEFLAVLPGADSDAAWELAEQMRSRVESSSLGATISIGLACQVPTRGSGVQQLVQLADRALYEAKAAGRNCTRSGS